MRKKEKNAPQVTGLLNLKKFGQKDYQYNPRTPQANRLPLETYFS